jgi:hypothetical protein
VDAKESTSDRKLLVDAKQGNIGGADKNPSHPIVVAHGAELGPVLYNVHKPLSRVAVGLQNTAHIFLVSSVRPERERERDEMKEAKRRWDKGRRRNKHLVRTSHYEKLLDGQTTSLPEHRNSPTDLKSQFSPQLSTHHTPGRRRATWSEVGQVSSEEELGQVVKWNTLMGWFDVTKQREEKIHTVPEEKY